MSFARRTTGRLGPKAALVALAPALASAADPKAPPPAAPMTAPVAEAHEHAALRRVRLPLRDFTLRRIDAQDGDPAGAITLSRFARGKRLVLLAYFAPWCANWRYQAPLLAELLARYRGRGLDLLAISEYAAREDTRDFFQDGQSGAAGPGQAPRPGGAPPYAVVYESESRDERERTAHFALRQAAGDSRKWGSPFLVFFKPAALGDPNGEAWVAAGELIAEDVERLLREQLGPPLSRRTRPGSAPTVRRPAAPGRR